MNSRQVTYVDKFSLEFLNKGTICNNALLLHDVDNDNYTEQKPRYTCDELGSISCLIAGKLQGRNVLCIICSEGEFHLFDLDIHGPSSSPVPSQHPQNTDDFDEDQNLSTDNSIEDDDAEEQLDDSNHSQSLHLPLHKAQKAGVHHSLLQSVHLNSRHLRQSVTSSIQPFATYRIPCNITCATLADIDGDGENEIVMAGTDRNIYVYRLKASVNTASESDLLRMYKLPMNDNQIFSLSTHTEKTGKQGILAGYVTGGYAFVCRGDGPDDSLQIGTFSPSHGEDSYISSKPMTVIGNAFDEQESAAFIELGGRVMVRRFHIQNNTEVNNTLTWHAELKQEVMGAFQGELVENSSTKQLVIATWDGITYILDKDHNAVCFNLKERICGFVCGMYNTSPTKPPSMCFFYVTFSDHRITVFYDIKLKSIPCCSLVTQIGSSEESLSKLKRLYSHDAVPLSDDKMRKIVSELTHLFYSSLYSFSDQHKRVLLDILREQSNKK
ncbi:hypothetical protein AKO1_015532 [Acrasis kona]|uniref:Uncharacterized protein n=1 Tax=Acrasis kona TaxID=1008807 RepID=A0AAW2ZGL8_9EUKA